MAFHAGLVVLLIMGGVSPWGFAGVVGASDRGLAAVFLRQWIRNLHRAGRRPGGRPGAPERVRDVVRLGDERRVASGLQVQTLVVVWYHLAGHSPKVISEHRNPARWNTTKTHPSYHDMLIKLRRVLIAAQYRADPALPPTPEQIQAIRLAWADAAA